MFQSIDSNYQNFDLESGIYLWIQTEEKIQNA